MATDVRDFSLPFRWGHTPTHQEARLRRTEEQPSSIFSELTKVARVRLEHPHLLVTMSPLFQRGRRLAVSDP